MPITVKQISVINMKEINRELFVKSGSKGGKQKGINAKATRKELLEKVSSQVDKEILDLIQCHLSNVQIIKLLKVWEK